MLLLNNPEFVKPITHPASQRSQSSHFNEHTWYAFELGREWKLSLAEIEAVFGVSAVIAVTPKLLLIQTELNVAQISDRI